MTRQVLLDVDPLQRALVAWLNTKDLGASALDAVAADTPPYIVLDPLPVTALDTGMRATTGWAHSWQGTTVGRNAQEARLIGGRLARAIAGADTSGAYLENDLDLPGVAVVSRASDGDGHGDLSGAWSLWIETFTLVLLPAA